ncbi:hypothetical protein [Nitratifractor sp.]
MSRVIVCDICGNLETETDSIYSIKLECRDMFWSEITDDVEHICQDCLNRRIEDEELEVKIDDDTVTCMASYMGAKGYSPDYDFDDDDDGRLL